MLDMSSGGSTSIVVIDADITVSDELELDFRPEELRIELTAEKIAGSCIRLIVSSLVRRQHFSLSQLHAYRRELPVVNLVGQQVVPSS